MASFSVEIIRETSKPLSQRIFERYDKDGSGYIDVAEFAEMVREHGIYLVGDALKVAMMEIDRNNDGKISYEEFKIWKKNSAFENLAMDDERLQHRVRIAESFDRFDTDKNGSLSLDELGLFHAELADCGLVEGSAEDLLHQIDKDGDGCVQFNELALYLEGMLGDLSHATPSAASVSTATATTATDTDKAPEVSFARASKTPEKAFLDPTSNSFPYEALKNNTAAGVDPLKKEEYLNDSEFLELFGVNKAAFLALPKWKRDSAKKQEEEEDIDPRSTTSNHHNDV